MILNKTIERAYASHKIILYMDHIILTSSKFDVGWSFQLKPNFHAPLAMGTMWCKSTSLVYKLIFSQSGRSSTWEPRLKFIWHTFECLCYFSYFTKFCTWWILLKISYLKFYTSDWSTLCSIEKLTQISTKSYFTRFV